MFFTNLKNETGKAGRGRMEEERRSEEEARGGEEEERMIGVEEGRCGSWRCGFRKF